MKDELYKAKLQNCLAMLGQRSSSIINAYYRPFISTKLKLQELDQLHKEVRELESLIIQIKRSTIFLDNIKD